MIIVASLILLQAGLGSITRALITITITQLQPITITTTFLSITITLGWE